MKFIVSSTALSSHLQAISRVINSKNALPILDCFLFELEDGTLSVTVSDSETTMVTTVEVNESDTNGRFAVVAKTLLDALKEIPEQPLTFEINPDNYEITVQYQNGKYSLMGQNADEFPQSATLGDNAVRVEMEASVLLGGINRSVFATADDELRPVMNGIYFDITTEDITMVASDGHKLMENAGQDLVACLFQREDTLQDAAAVLSLSVADVTEAERMLRTLVNTAPADEGRKTPRITFGYTVNKAYLVYRLPQTTLFKQLTSFVEATLDVYEAFYDGRLLLAPDENALSQYIRQLDKGEVLNGAMAYQAGMDHLSDSYHFMLMADFDHIFRQSENHVRFVPDFFLRNADFFHNFTLFVQFACTDGVVYPNIVLKYKSE